MVAKLISWIKSALRGGTPEDLLRLCQAYQLAVLQGNTRRAARLVRGLLLSQRRIRKAFRADAPAEKVAAVAQDHAALRQMEEKHLARLLDFRPDQIETIVHCATTEELAARTPGSVADLEFPGGAQRVASSLLRPGMSFYQVTFIHPDERYGKEYQLFFWDGWRWGMLGPVWRVVD
jgi:hypothetical protein